MRNQDKILVIQTAFPGDAILTLPMIQVLKKKFTNTEIDVLCIPSTKEIFESSPSVDSVVVIDKKGAQRKLFAFLKFMKSLKSRGYTIVFCPHRSFRSAFIVWMLGKTNSFGFSNSSVPYVFKNVVGYDPSAHEVQRNLDLIGLKTENDNWRILPELNTSESSKIKINQFIKDNDLSKFICIAPGSIWNTKMYPSAHLRTIIKYFSDKEYKIILTGSDDERSLCTELTFNNNVVSTAGLFSIVETIELMKHAKLVISNDSAPTHFGMAANIPVLTIFCSTVPSFGFYPYNIKSDYVSYDDLKCKPCGIHGYKKCPIDSFDCGNFLKPESVINKAIFLLEKYGS